MGRVCRMLFLVTLLFMCSSFVSSRPDALDKFMEFVTKFNKPYKNGTEEFRRRYEIFKKNLHQIEVLNKPYVEEGSAGVYGITSFSDMAQEEFKAQYLSGLRLPPHSTGKTTLLYQSEAIQGHQLRTDLPKLVDWRKSDAVSAIKDQGRCGACWAFSAAETIESAYAIKHNTSAPSLAVQELIDCSKKNYGCKGGDICLALNWVKGHGITYEKYYPLLDKDEDCKPIPPTADVVQISDFKCPSYVGKEDGILNILANHGPVAAAVDATTWNNYVGGIIRFHCENSINHAVEIVGYDLTGSVPYYIVRNSWGTGFGMDGYLYIKIGDNLCGIAQEVSSVTIV